MRHGQQPVLHVSSPRHTSEDVISATKTASPTSVFSAISDAATTQQEINKIKTKNIRMYHPWSSLTDGGLYDEYVQEQNRQISCKARSHLE